MSALIETATAVSMPNHLDEPMVEVSQLRKTYPGKVDAVKGIDFAIGAGEVFGLLGPNGAGKSTTIGMLTTTIKPTGGRARLNGFDVADEPLAARSVSSVVFQDSVIDLPLTGRRNIEIHARLWGVEAGAVPARIADTVELFGLSEIIDRPMRTYSGGERRRLEIARALISRPLVLFLDEPTVGLDPRIRHELLDVIARLRDHAKTTILLTTHYLDEAEDLCDRIAVMYQGSIVAQDTPAALLATLGQEIVELRMADDATSALAALRSKGVAGTDAFVVGSTLTIPLHEHTASDAIALTAELGVPTLAISTRRPTLDDVYLRLTGDRIEGAA